LNDPNRVPYGCLDELVASEGWLPMAVGASGCSAVQPERAVTSAAATADPRRNDADEMVRTKALSQVGIS
jgi:hypothetical protein